MIRRRPHPIRSWSLVCRPTAVVPAVLLALVVASCSDGEAASPTSAPEHADPPSIEEWRTAVESGCTRWNERYAHLRDAEPTNAEEALEHTEDVDALASALASEISEAGLPEGEHREGVRRLIELSEDLAATTGELASAAHDADGPAIDLALDRIDELGQQLNLVTEELEVPACGGY